MANKQDSENDSAFNSLDLSLLKDLSFGPDWASDKGNKRSSDSYRDHDGTDRRPSRGGKRPGGGNRDRRGGTVNRRPQGAGAGGGGNERGDRGDRGNRFDRTPRPLFEPTVDVIFVSQDKPFEVLLKAMRTTHKTYELFEIARIVLGKENRFIAIVSAKKEAEDQKLYVSAPDQLPFESREEAISHVMANHIERWFTIEEIEVDPPTGNFQMVNRCKLTGELLAPPNFHRYQDILKEHFSKNIHNLPWERFLDKIESVKDEAVVQEWLDKMKKTFRYTLKQKESDESPKVVLSALEDVRYYLTTERKNEVFLAKDKIRLPGEKIEQLPRGNLRRSIEREIEIQRRFPLITSNHLRGRLRRCNLNFFKKGSKGITFVCGVKRKPRYKDTVFSESIQNLIDFVETHPKILTEELLKEYKPEGVEEITEETQKTTIQDLRWLIGAGYVSEYADSALFAEKPLPINAADDKSNLSEPVRSKSPGKSARRPKKAKPTEAATQASEAATQASEAATEETPVDPEATVADVVADETPTEEQKVEATEKPEVEAVVEPSEAATEEKPVDSEATVADVAADETPTEEQKVEAIEKTEVEAVVETSEAEASETKEETPVVEEVKEAEVAVEAEKEEPKKAEESTEATASDEKAVEEVPSETEPEKKA